MALGKSSTRGVAVVLLVGMIASVVLASLVSFQSSPAPDGLERVAEDQGFAETGRDSATAGSPLADYAFGGEEDSRSSVATAGLAGVAITAAVAFGMFALLRQRGPRPTP